MGIIATIFTIITINFEAFKDKVITTTGVLSLNLSMAFITSFLVGILSLFTAKKKKWYFYLIYFLLVVVLFIANILIAKCESS